MVFRTNLLAFSPAFANSPCSKLFGIVTTFDKLFSELLTPLLNGEGKDLYTLETGLNIILSRPWLSAKEALLKPSQHSFISVGSFFFNNSSPSESACTFRVNARVVMIVINNFLYIVVLIM